MKQITVNRKFYDLLAETKVPDFPVLERVENEGMERVLISLLFKVVPGKTVEDLDNFYRDEHVAMLQKVPGWLRTRRFVSSSIEPKSVEDTEYLVIHEYEPRNGLGGPEFTAAVSTEAFHATMKNVVKEVKRRTYNLYYNFGSAPRDLESLTSKDTSEFTSLDKLTHTIPGTSPAIESYVKTKDGVVLPFRLEGSTDTQAPLIILSNSILVDYTIWDGFVAAFLSKPENKKYRIARYLTRGRSSAIGDRLVTVDVLGSDVIDLLDALRIPKAAAVIGVSLGGATALNVGLKYPDRVAAFISCDTSAKSPAGNSKAWSDRIEICVKEGSRSSAGESIVGEELAEITTRRWFVPESYDGGAMEKECLRIKAQVASNSLEGFKQSVKALWEYDMTPLLEGNKVKGLFVVGSGDGVLPKSMKELSEKVPGAGFEVVEGAGHLPMVEKPEAFAAVVGGFLG